MPPRVVVEPPSFAFTSIPSTFWFNKKLINQNEWHFVSRNTLSTLYATVSSRTTERWCTYFILAVLAMNKNVDLTLSLQYLHIVICINQSRRNTIGSKTKSWSCTLLFSQNQSRHQIYTLTICRDIYINPVLTKSFLTISQELSSVTFCPRQVIVDLQLKLEQLHLFK